MNYEHQQREQQHTHKHEGSFYCCECASPESVDNLYSFAIRSTFAYDQYFCTVFSTQNNEEFPQSTTLAYGKRLQMRTRLPSALHLDYAKHYRTNTQAGSCVEFSYKLVMSILHTTAGSIHPNNVVVRFGATPHQRKSVIRVRLC